MIRANGGICILLHMSLPNGRLHTEVMIIIEHGAQANCCTTHTHTNHGEEHGGGKEVKYGRRGRGRQRNKKGGTRREKMERIGDRKKKVRRGEKGGMGVRFSEKRRGKKTKKRRKSVERRKLK